MGKKNQLETVHGDDALFETLQKRKKQKKRRVIITVTIVVAVVLIALGMCFMMNMRLVANPPDSLVQVIGTKINKDTGKVKMGLDAVCVAISCCVDFMAHGRLTSIGLATVATMLFVGPTLTQCNRIFKTKILTLAGLAE